MTISPQARLPTWTIRQDLAGPYLASLNGFFQHVNGPDDELAARVSPNGPMDLYFTSPDPLHILLPNAY